LNVAGANPVGLFTNVSPPNNPNLPGLTAVGNVILFSGNDSSGHIGAWVTDGTAAGTSELTISGAHSGFGGLGPEFITVISTSPPPPHTSSDFNGDGKSDLLWQNSSGEGDIWELNGTSLLVAGSIGNPGASWHAVGTGDFNHDGHADILWQNDDGTVAVWELNGTSIIGKAVVTNPGPDWHAVGTGDYNGDGFSDIRLQNSSGQVFVWEMTFSNAIAVPSVCQVRSSFLGSTGALSPVRCQLGPGLPPTLPLPMILAPFVPPQNVGEAVMVEIADPMTCQLGPGLPMPPPPSRLEPLVFQIAASPLSFCHNRSRLPPPSKSPVALMCQVGPGLPGAPVPASVVPFINQNAAWPLSTAAKRRSGK
jgi:hypothetical protein